jgi:hypothetical protein
MWFILSEREDVDAVEKTTRRWIVFKVSPNPSQNEGAPKGWWLGQCVSLVELVSKLDELWSADGRVAVDLWGSPHRERASPHLRHIPPKNPEIANLLSLALSCFSSLSIQTSISPISSLGLSRRINGFLSSVLSILTLPVVTPFVAFGGNSRHLSSAYLALRGLLACRLESTINSNLKSS